MAEQDYYGGWLLESQIFCAMQQLVSGNRCLTAECKESDGEAQLAPARATTVIDAASSLPFLPYLLLFLHLLFLASYCQMVQLN